MKTGYCIDNKGNRIELFKEDLSLRGMLLVELVLPENCTHCYCNYNQLTKLIVNSNCEKLYCYHNNLTELILPANCIRCECYYNQLTSLIVNSNCKNIWCYNNKLTELIVPEDYYYCGCDNNSFSLFIAKLIHTNPKLSNQIFSMKECKLKSMLLSHDEETFELGLQILTDGILY